MNFLNVRQLLYVFVALCIPFLLTACQTTPHYRSATVGIDKALPGDNTRARYAHVIAGIKAMDTALSGKAFDLSKLPLDAALHSDLPAAAMNNGHTAEEIVYRLVETTLVDTGPYHLVQADTLTGRIEYRSDRANKHLSVTVRAPTTQEQSRGLSFVITEMFGQIALSELVNTLPDDDGIQKVSNISSTGGAASRRLDHYIVSDDSGELARLQSLPLVERDREDLLGLRAMLMMRLGNNTQASPLVQQGIVRYGDSPLFFVLAGHLFERMESAKGGSPEFLSTIMQQRFKSKEVSDSKMAVERFMNNPL